jgi:hypothetical protein
MWSGAERLARRRVRYLLPRLRRRGAGYSANSIVLAPTIKIAMRVDMREL